MPRLLDEEVTATYAGLRAAIDHGDYLIETDAAQRYLLVGGIRSTGSDRRHGDRRARPRMARTCGCRACAQDGLCPHRRRCRISARRSPARIRTPTGSPRTPTTARIVCFCERVTAGELRDAFCSTIPPAGLDGLRRRTRVMNGRCQGFFCGARSADLPGHHRARAGDSPMSRHHHADVAIVGARPRRPDRGSRARRRRDLNVVVLEREIGRRRHPAAQRPPRVTACAT